MSPVPRTAVVVPVSDADRLAAACTLARVRGQVVPVEGAGCVLLPAEGTAPDAAAAALSRLLAAADVVVLDAAEGSVSARAWRGGRRAPDPVAGLLLSSWPAAVQRLLLGSLAPEEVPGTRTGGEGPRWRAALSLARRRGA